MANIAVQRIKREFKEVLKSEEVRNELPDAPHLSAGREGPSGGSPSVPAGPAGCLAAALRLWGAAVPPPSAAFPSPPGPWGRSRGRASGEDKARGADGEGALVGGGSSRERPTAVATAGSVTGAGR